MKALPFRRPFYLNSTGTGAGAGYLLQTLEIGTEIDKETFSDAEGTIPNTNPIVLDAIGGFSLFYSGNLKLRLKTPGGATVWTDPNVEDTNSAGGALVLVENIDDLRDLDPNEFNQIILLGYYAAGDKDARVYDWDPNENGADNGGTIIKPTSLGAVPGRWVMEKIGEVTVLDFGAVGDGVTDDTLKMTKAIIFAQSKGTTLVVNRSPSGFAYLLDSNIAEMELDGWRMTILPGASIQFTNNQILGAIMSAGAFRWISAGGAGVITFNAKASFDVLPSPEWFGALGDGTGNQLAPLEFWLACGAPLLLISGGKTYETASQPTVPAGVFIISAGQIRTGLTIWVDRGIHGPNLVKINVDDVTATTVFGTTVTGDTVLSNGDVKAGEAGPGSAGIVELRAGTGVKKVKAGGFYSRNPGASATVVDGLKLAATIPILADSVEGGDMVHIYAFGKFDTITGGANVTFTVQVTNNPVTFTPRNFIMQSLNRGGGDTTTQALWEVDIYLERIPTFQLGRIHILFRSKTYNYALATEVFPVSYWEDIGLAQTPDFTADFDMIIKIQTSHVDGTIDVTRVKTTYIPSELPYTP
jgi:hypothetical protein